MKPLSSREFLKTPHRRWEKQGKFVRQRTINGHRRYDINQILEVNNNQSVTFGYARVSNHAQKADLLRDVAQKL